MVENELNFLSKSEQYGVLGNEATKWNVYSDEWLIHGTKYLSDYTFFFYKNVENF